MAGRHLKEIFRAFHARDELAFRRAAMEIIEEEQAKHHNALARDLQKLLVAGGGSFDSRHHRRTAKASGTWLRSANRTASWKTSS